MKIYTHTHGGTRLPSTEKGYGLHTGLILGVDHLNVVFHLTKAFTIKLQAQFSPRPPRSLVYIVAVRCTRYKTTYIRRRMKTSFHEQMVISVITISK